MDDPPPPFLPHTSLRELAAQVDPRYELDDEVADGQRAPWPGEGAGGVAAGWGTGTALRGYQRWQPNVCLVFNVLCSLPKGVSFKGGSRAFVLQGALGRGGLVIGMNETVLRICQ